MENRTIPRLTLDPNLPTMSLHRKATKCQTDSQPTGFITTAQPSELVEDSIPFCERDARTCILHRDMHPISLINGADFKLSIRGSELDRVLHQIDQHAPRHIFIHPNSGKLIRQA